MSRPTNPVRKISAATRRPQVGSSVGPFIRVAVVVIVLLGAVGLATVIRPSGLTTARGAENIKPVTVPLKASTLVCPETRYAAGKANSKVRAISAPPENTDGATSPGRLTVGELGQQKAMGNADKRDTQASVDVKQSIRSPLVAIGEESLAPGLVAGVYTRETEGSLRGLSEAPCVSPGSEFWFVGAGSELSRHPRLYVTNAEDAQARIDVTLYDKKGRIVSESTRGMDVPAHSQKVWQLDKYAPTSAQLAVRVVATRGRVAASLRDDQMREGKPAGVDWIPASVAPSRNLVVPGIPSGEGPRVLSIVAPGDRTAVVDLRVLGDNGSFQPADHGRLEIQAGAVLKVDLSKVSAKLAGGLRIISDVPVTASLRSELVGKRESTDKGENEDNSEDPIETKPIGVVRDVAYSAASTPLTGTAVVPYTPGGNGRSATLLLSTTQASTAVAEVTVTSKDGKELKRQKVSIHAGGTAEYKLPNAEGDNGYRVTVTPVGAAKICGVRVLTENLGGDKEPGPMVSIWPLESAPVTAVRPVARPDLGAF